MNVAPDSEDVTTYFVLRLAATGVEATGLTITNFDLQYVRSGAAPSAKQDATALALPESAHADYKAIEVDATDQPGLYRVDWPDAAFLAGVPEVILTVKCATCFTEHLAVALDTPGTILLAALSTVMNCIGAFTGTGVNTILGFLKALLRKDLAAPSDVGGAYDPATDSLEANRDNQTAVEASIRGADGDTLKTLSDQIDPLVPGSPKNIVMSDKQIVIGGGGHA